MKTAKIIGGPQTEQRRQAPRQRRAVTSWKQKYEALLKEHAQLKERMMNLGLMQFEQISTNDRFRLLLTEWLRKEHGEIRVTPNTLHTLKPDVMRKAKDRLYLLLGKNPKAKDIVHEVFRPPRRSRAREHFYYDYT